MDKAIFKNAWPYQNDTMNLPVANVETATAFYLRILGFKVLSRQTSPFNAVILGRDDIQIGIAENGEDPTQDGCFFEVDNIISALKEIRKNGMEKKESEIGIENHGGVPWKVFYLVAPDGLCYCLGELQLSSRITER